MSEREWPRARASNPIPVIVESVRLRWMARLRPCSTSRARVSRLRPDSTRDSLDTGKQRSDLLAAWCIGDIFLFFKWLFSFRSSRTEIWPKFFTVLFHIWLFQPTACRTCERVCISLMEIEWSGSPNFEIKESWDLFWVGWGGNECPSVNFSRILTAGRKERKQDETAHTESGRSSWFGESSPRDLRLVLPV